MPILTTGNSRYSGVTIDCGRFDSAVHDAYEPVVVFAILSKSTGWYDQTRKLKDYESVPTIRQYVCISQSEVRVSVWRRDGEDRFAAEDDLVEGGEHLLLIGVSEALPLIGIYEGTGLLEAS